ncbi:MAG: DNA repair protein RadC [Candidatus Brocadiales bacterium]|nr:DNA repair protein RadC [Candidatus Brocadiales bacterium]
MRTIKDYSDFTIIAEYKRRFESVSEAPVKSSKASYQALLQAIADDKDAEKDREHFYVMFLNGQNKVIKIERMFTGTITSSAVYPREVIKAILKHEAAAIILMHNHPSGEITPSSSDRAVTTKLKAACESIDVDILDHIIIGKTEYYSFSDHNLL